MGVFKLAWGQKVSPVFRARVLNICRNLGWPSEHASWLMACMAFESGGTFSPHVKNMAGSGATGLIQFMPATAQSLGTTTDELAKMSATQQLDYVQRYFKPYASKIRSLSDMYMAILLPKYVGQSEDAVLFQNGAGYRQNSGLDINRDGKITKGEATSKVRYSLEKGLSIATEEPCF